MAKKKHKQNLREYRSSLAALKRAGLISQKIDARSHKPTRHMLGQIEKFKDVIEGNARAVKTPSRATAREFLNVKRTKFDRVVIKIQKGDGVPRYNSSTREIKIRRKSYYPDVDNFNQILRPQSADELPILPPDTYDKVYQYGIPFRRGTQIRRIFADSLEELIKLMQEYDPDHGGRFKDWKGYVEVLEFDREDLPEDEFEISRDFDDEETGQAAYERSRKAKAQPRDKKGRFIKAGGGSTRAKKRPKTARKNSS